MSGYEDPLSGELATADDIFELEEMALSRLASRSSNIHLSKYFEAFGESYMRLGVTQRGDCPAISTTCLSIGTISLIGVEQEFENLFDMHFGLEGTLVDHYKDPLGNNLPKVIEDLRRCYGQGSDLLLRSLINHAHAWSVSLGLGITDSAHVLSGDCVPEAIGVSDAIEILAEDSSDFQLKDKVWEGKIDSRRSISIEVNEYLAGTLSNVPKEETFPALEAIYSDRQRGAIVRYARTQSGEVTSGVVAKKGIKLSKEEIISMVSKEPLWPRRSHIRFLISKLSLAKEVVEEGADET